MTLATSTLATSTLATSTLALALILAFIAGPAAQVAAQPNPPQGTPTPETAADHPIQLTDLMTMMAAVPERRAIFQEEKRFAALAEPLLSTGHLIYRRPGHLEKITDAPQAEKLIVDGDHVSLSVANSPTQVTDLSTQPELRVLVEAMRGPLAGDTAALERAFKVAVRGTRSAWRLDLTPIDPRAAKVLSAVRISGSGPTMREVLLIQANGDTQYMSITPTT
jgi:hypothetical protein